MVAKTLSFRRLQSMFAFALIIGIIVAACRKTGTTTPPSLATFLNQQSGTYFITDATVVDTIPVGVTAISAKDRTIGVNVSSHSGAVAGTQYTLSGNSVTIPAGQTLGYIVVKGNYSHYNGTTLKDTLVFTFATGGEIPPADFNDTFTLIMRGPCVEGYDFDAAEFDGIYNDVSDDGTASLIPVNIQNLGAAFFVPGPSDPVSNPGIAVKIDWSNPPNLTATIDSQAYSTFVGFGPVSIVTEGTPGTFSSCHQTFSLNYDILVGGSDFGLTTSTISR
jgi:hypothetical protein